MGRQALIAFGLLSGCWYEHARPARPTTPSEPTVDAPTAEAPTSSYRASTIAADTIGVVAMAAGLIGLQRGRNDDISGGLLVGGLATAGFVTPIIHLAHGNTRRAGTSYLMRSLMATTGTLVGYAATASCSETRDQLLCGITRITWGVTGGLAVGAALDAIFLHGSDERSSRTWMPTVTPGDGGARVGILGAF
jgi:hypothetical protein